MKLRFGRYTPEMLHAVGNQSLTALALNAVVRGALFTSVIQLLTYFTTGSVSSLLQVIVLAFVFSLFVFSVDLIEKYWAQSKSKSRY